MHYRTLWPQTPNYVEKVKTPKSQIWLNIEEPLNLFSSALTSISTALVEKGLEGQIISTTLALLLRDSSRFLPYVWFGCFLFIPLPHKIFLDDTLHSEINVPPGINVAPPLKNFYIMILILFYINLGIVVIFIFFLSSKILKN